MRMKPGRNRFLLIAGLLVAVACWMPQAYASPSMTAISAIFAGIVSWAATHPGATGIDSGSNVFFLGAFDRIDKVKQTWDISYQYQWGRYLVWHFKPLAGGGVTGRRSVYVFGGLGLGVHLGAHVILGPSLALAAYFHGGGKNLGSIVNFRSGISVDWCFNDGIRFGLAYHHLSHWFLFGNENPATEILSLNLSIQVGQ